MDKSTITLNQLKGMLNGVKRGNGNGFTALCPGHDDKRQSLSVTLKADRILIKCHAGCEFDGICAALGIHPAQLFFADSDRSNGQSKIETIYDYFDESNDLRYQVLRNHDKKFVCRRPDGNGGWIYNLKGIELIQYRLPEILELQKNPDKENVPIIICEGEKDVETLRAKGFIATCNPHGAGKWKDSYSKLLKGLNCVIASDNDEAGRQHAQHVASSVHRYAKSVKVLSLEGLPEKGDITDWFLKGNTKDDLLGLISSTENWRPVPGENTHIPLGLQLTPVSELLAEVSQDIEFVWDEILLLGGTSILTGKPKLGKSSLARNLAVNASRGNPFLGKNTLRGTVIYFCLEEHRQQIQKIFRKMGLSDEPLLICTHIQPDSFLKDLAAAIAEHEPVLVIIDPMSRAVRERDFNDYPAMARALEPIVDIARKFETHIMLIHHDNKGRVGNDSILGSTAIFGAVDTHLQITSREGGQRTLKSTNRYGKGLPETVLDLTRETGVISAKGTLETVTQKNLEQKIADSMSTDEPITEKEIKKRVGTHGSTSKALRLLVETGYLTRSGAGKKGNPYKYSKNYDI